MNHHTEARFEDAITHWLTRHGGYQPGNPAEFDAALGLFPAEVVAFVQDTQPTKWAHVAHLAGPNAQATLLDSLTKELATKGVLHVVRHGFKCCGKTFRLAYFQPNTQLNPQTVADYEKNRLRVTRQVHFSTRNPALSVDVVLSLNGLPLVTLELKNPMTGQTAEHAKRQYRHDRDPREPLFTFKARALVHFALAPDTAWMTTRVAGKETVFLPFNKGCHGGAGNPPADGYKTAYLWEEVLTRDSLLDIVARFVHLEAKEKTVVTDKGIKRHRKETMIFPRYHQLNAVRRLTTHARQHGAGRNYLIQHSAGSGKSNSIAWLAHRLSSLHDAQNRKVFDTVIVITDRLVLDQQLQDTIYQFEHKQGVVQKIDENTQQLAKALADGTPIIISTLQKFPFISQAIATLAKRGEEVALSTAGKRFAVIVDEAHSSQSGESAMELRKILNKDGIEAAIAAQLLQNDTDEDDGLSPEARENLLREMLKRPRQDNISYFAFTATPKYKTLAFFNEPGPDGQAPFHRYTMRQAIEEGFILDVLAHYTTYKTYFGLVKAIEDDPDVPKRKAAKALARFMSLHPYNIGQKVEVIVEHFRTFTRHKIGGRAKAMVVTSSRLHAVRYKRQFDQYLKDKGYTDIRTLVAFSGKVTDPDLPGQEFTEVAMNHGIKEAELPDAFAGNEYQVLLVADKYQTGFDQPLLHTMYVDKRLSGIQAVQTLSRLNRTTAGKEDTFVLDFANEPEDIHAAFKDYYEATPLGVAPDPQQLYALHHRVMEARVFAPQDVTDFCQVWFSGRSEPTASDHQKLNAILDRAVAHYSTLEDEDQELFRATLESFRRLYAFLSQMVPYQDSDLEKLYTYSRFLLTKLPHPQDLTRIQVEDDVALKFYRLQKISEGSIDLRQGSAQPLKGPTEVGTRQRHDDDVSLSTLIDRLNDRFGTEFTPADQLFFEQVAEAAAQNEDLQEAAQANTLENFALVFNKMLERLFIERMEGNEGIFKRLMEDDAFRSIAARHLIEQVYGRLRGEATA